MLGIPLLENKIMFLRIGLVSILKLLLLRFVIFLFPCFVFKPFSKIVVHMAPMLFKQTGAHIYTK